MAHHDHKSELSMDETQWLSGFPYFGPNVKSLLKKNLTPEMYQQLKDKRTSNGFTIDQAIQSGVDNQDSGVGVYAGDEESFTLFAPLFDRVVSDYHGGYAADARHVSDLDPSHLVGSNPDPEGKYIISTRIRVGRNIRGCALPAGCSRAQRRLSEKLTVDALRSLEGDLAGKYYPLGNLTEAEANQLIADHFLFKRGDRFLASAGCNRDWPDARGIFHNNEKTFLVWVNEEDGLRIISMQPGGDFVQVFERLTRAIHAMETSIRHLGYEFAYNDHLGFIHCCPSNLGTGMRASVHVRLPHLSKHAHYLDIVSRLRLQSRGIHGEHSESEGGVYDISNKERLGKSEVSLVQTMIDGVTKLIQLEKQLEGGQSIDQLVASL